MAQRPIQTNLRTSKQLNAKIERYAKKLGLSKNQLMNNLLEAGLEDLRILEAVGLLQIGIGIRSLTEMVRDREGLNYIHDEAVTK